MQFMGKVRDESVPFGGKRGMIKAHPKRKGRVKKRPGRKGGGKNQKKVSTRAAHKKHNGERTNPEKTLWIQRQG